MELGVSGLAVKDIERLNAHYQAAVALRENHKYLESDKEWDAFSQIIDCYIEDGVWFVSHVSFEDYMKTIEENRVLIRTEEKKILKSYYNRAIGFERAFHFKEAETLWQQFNVLLNRQLGVI